MLVTLDTKSGWLESGAGDVGGDESEMVLVWTDGEKEKELHGDDLVPFFMSPKAYTAMRTLSSWSSREIELDDGDDDEGDERVIVCEQERALYREGTCSHHSVSRVFMEIYHKREAPECGKIFNL